MIGWKCPNCGGGNAPSVKRCPCVPVMAPLPTTPADPFAPLRRRPPQPLPLPWVQPMTPTDWPTTTPVIVYC